MIKEIFEKIVQEGISKPITNFTPERFYFGGFTIDRYAGTILLGIGWGMYFKHCLTKTKFRNKDNSEYEFWRDEHDVTVNATLYQILGSTVESDVNHISSSSMGKSYSLYPFISRDDNRLGDFEWYYADIKPPSIIMSNGHLNDIYKNEDETIEYAYFKKAMKMCGKFPKSHLKELFLHCSVQEFESGEFVLEIGDPDQDMIIILSGEIRVMSVNDSGAADTLRFARKGDKFYSLFSFVDVLTGHSKPLNTIEAFATEHSRVLKFPTPVFKDYLHLYPHKITDVIRRLVRKIYDINYIMLHRSLGITTEIMHPHSHKNYVDKLPEKDDTSYIPNPADELPKKLRYDAIIDLMRFLGVKKTSFELFQHCPVFILDPDPRDNPIIPAEHKIIDDRRYKFKYIYKGKVEMYKRKKGVIHKYYPTEESNGEEKVNDPEDKRWKNWEHESLCVMQGGEGLGGLATFAEQENILFVKVLKRTVFVTMTEPIMKELFSLFPETIYPIANQIIRRLSPLVRLMDFGIEWALVEGGKALYVTGNPVQDTFMVLGGKLRSYMNDPKGQLIFYGEYDKGDWIGLIEAVVMFPIRSKTVVAVRNTEVCRVPMFYINFFKEKFPSAAFNLLRNLAGRSEKHRLDPEESQDPEPKKDEMEGTSRYVASMAIIPLSEDVPIIPFVLEIKKHHDRFGQTAIVSWLDCKDICKIQSISNENEFSVLSWFMNLLSRYYLVIFICSDLSKKWSEICIRHSELVVSIGVQGHPIQEHWLERLMLKKRYGISIRKELVILHRDYEGSRHSDKPGYVIPKNTIGFLESRPWTNIHHHLRLPVDAFDFLGLLPVEIVKANYKSLLRYVDKHSDMSRYNRWLIGKAIGIVFTGGGSRMAAQLGVLNKIIEQGLSIDMVGGVGTGLIVAAFYSIYQDIGVINKCLHEFYRDIDAAKRSHKDVTAPYISSIQGRAMLRLCEKHFGSTRMEDTWIPIFGITCDINKQDARIHRNGSFWIYCRAALSNFLFAPPINDPRDGGYIVDGSFANPVPEDIMRNFGCEFVLVINTALGATIDPLKIDYSKDVFTNLWRTFVMLASKLNFLTPDIVTINDMISRTQKIMYAEAVQANTDGLFVVFIRPDTECHAAHNYTEYGPLRTMGETYMKTILRNCPVIGEVPFRVYWTRLRMASMKLEQLQGRAFQRNINEEFWDKLDDRIFERDDKIMYNKTKEFVKKYGDRLKGNHPHEIEAFEQELQMEIEAKNFKQWMMSSDPKKEDAFFNNSVNNSVNS